MTSIKKHLGFTTLLVILGLAIYGSHISKEHRRTKDLAICKNWYTSSFHAWKDWPSLKSEEKFALEKLNPQIDSIVSNACNCAYTRSEVFREQIISKFGFEATDSFVNILNAEMKKYQAECAIPDFFVWTADIKITPTAAPVYMHSNGH